MATYTPVSGEITSTGINDIASAINSELESHLADLVTDADGAHGIKIESGTWTPTLTWTTATPVTEYLVGYYRIIGKHCFFQLYFSTLDGLGATDLTISPPVAMKNLGGWSFPITTWMVVGTTIQDTTMAVHEALNVISFITNPPTFTNGQSAAIRLSGFFETN